MGYFNELETDVLDLYCANVPAEKIAEEYGISIDLVEKIGKKWEQENNLNVVSRSAKTSPKTVCKLLAY